MWSTILRIVVFSGCLLGATCLAIEAGPQSGKPAVTYFTDVRPLLEKNCFRCHGRWFPSHGLRLISLKSIRKGGNSGPVVIPGEPEKSKLVQVLQAGPDAQPRMPPKGPRLAPEQIKLIVTWIEKGAE